MIKWQHARYQGMPGNVYPFQPATYRQSAAWLGSTNISYAPIVTFKVSSWNIRGSIRRAYSGVVERRKTSIDVRPSTTARIAGILLSPHAIQLHWNRRLAKCRRLPFSDSQAHNRRRTL